MGKLLGIAYRQASRSPMIEADQRTVNPENGVSGDFRGRPGKRQVTVMSEDTSKQA